MTVASKSNFEKSKSLPRRSRGLAIGFGLLVWAVFVFSRMIAVGSAEDGLAPAPDRFPEANRAFLYMAGRYAELPAAAGSAAVLIAIYLWVCREVWSGWFEMDHKRARKRRLWIRVYLISSLVMPFVAQVLLACDQQSYDAITDAGYIGRDFWTGAMYSEPWLSVRYVEVECGGGGRRVRDTLPIVTLRFQDGRSTFRSVLDMKSYRKPEGAALAHFDDLRMQVNAPVVWGYSDDQARFQSGRWDVKECAQRLADFFPRERRERLVASLATTEGDPRSCLINHLFCVSASTQRSW